MKNLLFICGFSGGIHVNVLADSIRNVLKREDLLTVWIDPNRDPRAVALFKNELDEEKLHEMNVLQSFVLEKNNLAVETTLPTWSIFVRTYGVYSHVHNAKSELKEIFTLWNTKSNCEVPSVVHLYEDCFEITYQSGWETILKVCRSTWKAGDKVFTVCPFFPCFKEHPENQYSQIILKSEAMLPKKVAGEIKNIAEEYGSISSNILRKQHHINIPAHLSFIKLFLDILKFEDAVKKRHIMFEVHGTDGELELVFHGPEETSLPIIQIIELTTHELQDKLTSIEKEFLNLEKVQNKLTEYMKLTEPFIALLENDATINVVTTQRSEKVSLLDFISILIKKDEVQVLSNDFLASKDWMDFRESLNKSCNFCHAFENNLSVTLLYFSFWEADYEQLVNGLRATIFIFQNKLHQQNSDSKAPISTHKELETRPSEKITRVVSSEFHLPSSIHRWLLKTLHLKLAVETSFPYMTMDYSEDYDEIIFKEGKTTDITVNLVKTISTQCKKVEEVILQLLESKSIQDIVETYVKTLGWKIKISSDTEHMDLYVKSENDTKMTLDEFLTHFFMKRKCATFYHEATQKNTEWISFVNAVHEKDFPFIHIVVDKLNVTLYAVLEKKEKAFRIITEIDQFIQKENLKSGDGKESLDISRVNFDDSLSSFSKFTGNLPRNDSLEDEYDDNSKVIEKNLQETFFFDLIPHEYEYSKIVLKNKMAIIQQKYQNLCSEIKLVDERIRITCYPECKNNIFYDLKDDFEIISHQKIYIECAGVLQFIESQEGQILIEELSQTFKCVIQFPTANHNQAGRYESSVQNLVPLNYSVILCDTVRFDNFNIHLVRGKIEDMQLNLKVKFKPTADEKSTIKQSPRKNSCHSFDITLPEWKAAKGDKEHLTKLRSSLRECVNTMIIQAEEQTSMAFSTELMHEAQFPFPLDTVAEILVSQLYYNFSTANSASKGCRPLDVYICEPIREAVFKAFAYFFNKFGGQTSQPDQEAWSRVCLPDSSKVVDYHHCKTKVKISSNKPAISVLSKKKMLFCYPIDPNLQVDSCPANKEWLFDERHMKDSLRKIQNANPEGLVVGDVRPVRCFYNRRDVRIYCSSAWGADCEQTIKLSLQGCIIASNDYDELYIVPPGLHTKPPFPKQFLVQTLFKELDNLMQTKLMKKLKKIVFVVKKADYKIFFEKELLKRYPTKTVYPSPPYISNSLLKSNSRNPHIVETEITKTLVSFWGMSNETIDIAKDALDSHLKHLLYTNNYVSTLNSQQTLEFEKKLKNCKEIYVHVKLQKPGSAKNYHSKDSVLTISGLTKELVSNFRTKMGI